MKPLPLICTSALLLFSLVPIASAAPPSAGQVVIINTGDRLTPGCRVTVTPGGALTARFGPPRHPQRRTDQMIAVNRRRFFADLARAEPAERAACRVSWVAPTDFYQLSGAAVAGPARGEERGRARAVSGREADFARPPYAGPRRAVAQILWEGEKDEG